MLERAKAWKSSLLSGLSRGGVFRLQWTREALQSTVLAHVGEEDSIFCVKGAAGLNCVPRAESFRVTFFPRSDDVLVCEIQSQG